jgi:hypothetical protein
LLWAALVLVLTLTPAADMPITPVWELLSFDTAAHAGVFVVLAGLSWFSLRRQTRWPLLARYAGAIALLTSILFGGLIEVLQHTMHLGRHGDWTDLLSDAIGAALAVGIATFWVARHRQPRPLSAVFLLLLNSTLAALTAQGQDLPRARRTIARLAAPELHGRGYVQQGEHKAAAYLRGRLRELKLQPLAPNYTQPFTLDVNTFPGEVRLAVTASPGARPRPADYLTPGLDYIVGPSSAPADFRGEVIPLDTLIFQDTAKARHYLLPSLGVPTKACVSCPLLLRQRDQLRLLRLPAVTQARIAEKHQLILVPKLTASLAGQQSQAWRLEVLASQWPLVQTSRQWTVVKVDAQLQRNYQTQNLAAIIRGRAQPDSFLVVSAHYDHLGMMGRRTYFPGANDNASGVALLLELAAHYARPENHPAYSVVLLLFGAEEAGLVGSRYFVAHPLVPLKSIKFLVNLDLLGTGEEGATIVNGRVFEAPYRRLLALNNAHHYLPALGARGRAANSDHFPFSEAGVPAFFMYTRGGSPAYHDVNDKPAALSLAGFAGAFGLVRDFLGELGAAPTAKK